jgi:ATP-dependent exoDNAse (exonuclease V) beta subunit
MGNVKIIAASAGSGKTYRLAYEYVRSVVENPTLYRHILAVTFTNKATEEMSARILERLHELATPDAPSPYLVQLLKDLPLGEAEIRWRAKEAQGLILHDYSRFAVLTIDRFFQRLIRSFLRELGIEGSFNLELETDSILELAADALIEQSVMDEEVRERVFAATAGKLEEGKQWDIRGGLVALGSELFGEEYLKAVGGDSEATSTLIDAIITKAASAQRRFREAALSAQKIIVELGLSADDFRGKSKGLTSYLAKARRGEFVPMSAYARAEMDNPARPAALREPLAEMDETYETSRRLVASAALLRENRHNFVLLGDLQQQVERICREENIVSIAETGRMIARLVGGNDTPFIFERAGSYFSRFFIDEFQDTSSAQWENFVPLLRNAIASEEGTPVMLIGDVKQAIYRWRGSDWRILSRRVREQMGADRVEAESLDVNYRSLPCVVEFNNMAVGRLVEAGNGALDGMLAEARAKGAISEEETAELVGMLAGAYEGHTQRSHAEGDEGYVTLTIYGSDSAGNYVPPVVERIEELQRRGYRAGDIAVLVRSNSGGARIARMLLDRKRENPASPYCYDVVTQEALTVGASAASRFVIACLSLTVSLDNDIQRAVVNRWLERDFDAPLTSEEETFFARLAALSPEEAFEETVLRFGLNHHTADIAYIQALHGQIVNFSSRKVADLPLFLEWWNERGAAASITMQQDNNAITISTIHKSKGLQYKVVIVPYLSWPVGADVSGKKRLVVWADSPPEGEFDGLGSVPVNYKKAMAESHFSERYYREQVLAHIDAVNLFYVAATRAERELHLMSSSNPRGKENSVGNMLRRVLGVTDDFTEWGAPLHPARSDRAPRETLATYPTAPPDGKLRLRLPSARYIEEGGGDVALSPRDMGVLMHRAFEGAATGDDVRRALSAMTADGLISSAEHARLQDSVARAFSNPLVAEWFSGEWETVRNEGDILLPGDFAIRRPDRVMTRGERAVVVDYKFGLHPSAAHVTQLRGYMELLARMGYRDVEGWLWYVSLDKIERV